MKGILQGRTQVLQIAQVVATAAGRRSFAFDTDSQFKTVRGFYLIRPTGADYIEIAIKDANGNFVLETVTTDHITYTNFSPPIKDRFFKETPFQADGQKCYVELENFAPLTAAHEFHVVLLLDNEDVVAAEK